MTVFFLTSNSSADQTQDLQARLMAAIPDLAPIADISEIPPDQRRIAGNPIWILMTGPGNDKVFVDNFISIAARNRDNIFFILISDDIATSDYKRLQSNGAEWVSTAGATQEIVEILRRSHGLQTHREAIASPEPTVIAFVPSAGGVGNSKLAAEVAVWLKNAKATKNRRLALIDLDFQTSHISSYLDVEPKFRIEEIARSPERLDAQMLDIFTSRHGSGVDVIAAPRSKFDLTSLTVEVLDAFFNMASTRYDLILIDLPVTWFGWTDDIVANSDALVVTGINTVPCLHQIVERVAAIRSARSDDVPVSIVINRSRRGLFGGIANRKQVQRVLPREKIFYIGDHTSAMTHSVNTGAPLVTGYGTRRATKEIEALARGCAQTKSLRSPAPPSLVGQVGRRRTGMVRS